MKKLPRLVRGFFVGNLQVNVLHAWGIHFGMRKSSKENAIVVATIVLCFMLTLGLANIFSGEGAMSAFSKREGRSFFAICVGGYNDLTMARQSAELVQARAGAGFVLKGDEDIEIVYAIFDSNQLAQNVLEQLGEKGAYIKQIDIPSTKLKWCDKEQKQIVTSALKYFDIAFDTLFDTADSINRQSISFQEAKIKIKVLYAQIEDIKSEFYQNVQDMSEDEVTQIKVAIVTALALLDNIKDVDSVALFAAQCRHQLVQLVLVQQALMQCI